MKKLIGLLFYGNIFYGFCTVALSIETNLQHGIALNSLPFYILIFFSTVVYYSRIYYRSSVFINIDERSAWYRQHRQAIKSYLIISNLAIVAAAIYMLLKNFQAVYVLPKVNWLPVAAVLLIGVMYTFRILPVRKLRQVGWLKPFAIGFVWAGIITIFPILFWHIKNPGASTNILIPAGLLWLQNFLFITALAIVFDIKDHDVDKQHQLNTFPAVLGISKTIVFVIIPLTILSFSTLFIYHLLYQYSIIQTVIQALPYIALLVVSRNLGHQKNLLFYLAAIDGLMLFKAICGIISISFLQ